MVDRDILMLDCSWDHKAQSATSPREAVASVLDRLRFSFLDTPQIEALGEEIEKW